VALTMMLAGCAASGKSSTLVVRGWSNPAGGNHPGAIREVAGVATDACQAWVLNMGSFGGERWEVHLRVPTGRIATVRHGLLGTPGVDSANVEAKPPSPEGSGVARTVCLLPRH